MHTYDIFTKEKSSSFSGNADFLLLSFDGLTEVEFLTKQTFTSLKKADNTEEISKYLYSPLLITRAIHNLTPFSNMEVLNLAQGEIPSQSAKETFDEGMKLGRSYELKGNYLLLALNSQDIVQNATDTLSALSQKSELSIFETLSLICDKTLIFYAGFLLEASRRFHVVVSGGVEMAVSLLIADLLREDVLMRLKSQNITYATTSWAIEEATIVDVLEKLSYKPHAIYTAFDTSNAEIEDIKKIGLKDEKDKAGAGGALAYGAANSLSDEALLNEMELIVYML